MKLRNRDIAAAILSVVLARMAWTDTSGPESLSATVHLAFYSSYRSRTANPNKAEQQRRQRELGAAAAKPWRGHGFPPGGAGGVFGGGFGVGLGQAAMTADLDAARPVPLDVDGDGVVEALVVPAVLGTGSDSDERGGGTGADGGGGAEWGLRVLDLKPMHATRGPADELASFPFRPRIMFESRPIGEAPAGAGGSEPSAEATGDGAASSGGRDAVPLRMATGQLYLRPAPAVPVNPKDKFVPSTDRTRHYFCGEDWHDAARRCGAHCPSGTSSECPEGQSCYADTPCDSQSPPTPPPTPEGGDAGNRTVLVETPGGGLPSVVTAWSDGAVTLHSVTGEYNPAERRRMWGKKKKKKRRKGEPDPDLELRLMWRARPFEAPKEEEKEKKKDDGEGDTKEGDKKEEEDKDKKPDLTPLVSFQEIDLTLDPEAPLGRNGAVLLAARYQDSSAHTTTSYHALDARTGEVMWSHRGKAKPVYPWMMEARQMAKDKLKAQDEKEARKSLVDARRMTGIARRRSHLNAILGEDDASTEVDDVAAAEDCLVKYRHWILDPSTGALPHLHWGSGGGGQDAALRVAHFDRRHSHVGRERRGGGGGGGGGALGKKGPGSRAADKSRADPAKREWQKKMLVAPRRSAAAVSPAGSSGSVHEPAGGKKKKKKRKGGGAGGHAIHAKPNVLLFHHRDGLSVLSLRNGRPVCHLSLLDDSLYDDLNGDGVLDQVQVLRGVGVGGQYATAGMYGADDNKKESAKFTNNLVQRVMKERREETARIREEAAEAAAKDGAKAGATPLIQPHAAPLCHAIVLSGLPAREEVFSASLCDDAAAQAAGGSARQRKRQEEQAARGAGARGPSRGVGAAPPLAVESLASPGERDVVFAVGTGSASRYDPHGAALWTSVGPGGAVEEGGMPTWGPEAPPSVGAPPRSPALLGRIDFPAARRVGSPAVRPILVSGEDGLAVLSAGRGRVLASAAFPQAAASRPILADVSGDGTTDVVVVSADGVWGYKVRVETGGSKFLRIAVGLLLMGIGAAALWNKFGQPPGVDRRSTDE